MARKDDKHSLTKLNKPKKELILIMKKSLI